MPYDRLPGRAEGVVRPEVWNLSRHSAGIRVGFSTDATSIRTRSTLTVDGSHPTDLGFDRMTDVFSIKIGEILDAG